MWFVHICVWSTRQPISNVQMAVFQKFDGSHGGCPVVMTGGTPKTSENYKSIQIPLKFLLRSCWINIKSGKKTYDWWLNPNKSHKSRCICQLCPQQYPHGARHRSSPRWTRPTITTSQPDAHDVSDVRPVNRGEWWGNGWELRILNSMGMVYIAPIYLWWWLGDDCVVLSKLYPCFWLTNMFNGNSRIQQMEVR